MNLRQSLSLASLLLTLAILGWIWTSDQALDLALSNTALTNNRNTPDFIITQLKSQQFDEQGALKYTLRAQQLNHYPNGIAQITVPLLNFSDHAADNPWQITALTGQVNDLNHQVRLQQQVQLTQPFAATAQAWQMSTDDLAIDLDQAWVTTNRPVLLRHASGAMESQGMRSNLKTHQIELLNHVRGHYAPQ